MKNYIWLSLLTVTITALSSHNGYQELEDISLDTENKIKNFYKSYTPPVNIMLGNQTLTPDKLQNTSQEQVNILLQISYPSILERFYGKNNQTITIEDLEKIDEMPGEIRNNLRFNILPTQGSCIMSNEGECRNYYCSKGCLSGIALCGIGTISGVIWGMCSPLPAEIMCKAFWLKIFLPSSAFPPACSIAGEVISCMRNRWCREKEIWTHNPVAK